MDLTCVGIGKNFRTQKYSEDWTGMSGTRTFMEDISNVVVYDGYSDKGITKFPLPSKENPDKVVRRDIRAGSVGLLRQGGTLWIAISDRSPPDREHEVFQVLDLNEEPNKVMGTIRSEKIRDIRKERVNIQRKTLRAFYDAIVSDAALAPPPRKAPAASTATSTVTSPLDQYFGKGGDRSRKQKVTVIEGPHIDPASSTATLEKLNATIDKLSSHFDIFKSLYLYYSEKSHTRGEKPIIYKPWYDKHKDHLLGYLKAFPSYEKPSDVTYPSFIRYKTYLKGSTVIFIGDLHGGFHVLLRMVNDWIDRGYMDANGKLAENHQIVFLGDIADRGFYGLPNYMLIGFLNSMQQNKDRIICIRGNHETIEVAGAWERTALFNEVENNVRDKNDKNFVDEFVKCLLPMMFDETSANFNSNCMYFRFDGDPEYFYCAHGILPISANILGIEATGTYLEPYDWPKVTDKNAELADAVMWSDLGKNDIPMESNRGKNIFTFDYNTIRNYCSKYNVKFVIRGHQDMCPTRLGIKHAECGKPGDIDLLVCRDHRNSTETCVKDFTVPDAAPAADATEDTFLITTSSAMPARPLIHNFVYVVLHDNVST